MSDFKQANRALFNSHFDLKMATQRAQHVVAHNSHVISIFTDHVHVFDCSTLNESKIYTQFNMGLYNRAVAMPNNCVYMFGGSKMQNNKYSDDLKLLRWNMPNAQWTSVETSGAEIIGRVHLGMAARTKNNSIIVYSGFLLNGKRPNDMYECELKNNKWNVIQMNHPLPPARCAFLDAYVHATDCYVMGFGFDGANHYNDLWMFHCATRNWQQIVFPQHVQLVKNSMLTFASSENRIFVHRLKDESTDGALETLDLQRQTRTMVEGIIPAPHTSSKFAYMNGCLHFEQNKFVVSVGHDICMCIPKLNVMRLAVVFTNCHFVFQ